jgi:hypothetical protein
MGTISSSEAIKSKNYHASKKQVLLSWKVVIPPNDKRIRSFHHHYMLEPLIDQDEPRGLPEYGGIDFHAAKGKEREVISPQLEEQRQYEEYRSNFLEQIDEDMSSSDYPLEDLEDEEPPHGCRKIPWTLKVHRTCNIIHEVVVERPVSTSSTSSTPTPELQDYRVMYLSHGNYRDAWRFQRSDSTYLSSDDEFVMKRYQLRKKHVLFGYEELHQVGQEAVFMEQMTLSPHILDIYAACGTSVLVEAMKSDIHHIIVPGKGIASQENLDKLGYVQPQNNLTISEKLQISLDMAKSLADLHEHDGGAIIHGDTHIEQWLLARDGTVKLNDFNNAYTLDYNEKRNGYCPSYGVYDGTYRSPEEFSGDYLEKSVDTYAFGNNIYTLLTGLWPFYDEEYKNVSHDKIQDDIIAGKRPFVDDRYRKRSYIEEQLINIMVQCWHEKRNERPLMSSVVASLKNIKRAAAEKGELEKSVTLKIELQ